MDLNKLSTADRVIVGASIVFLISMFLPWYGVGDVYSKNGTDWFLTGWLPLLLMIAMVVQIGITRFSTTHLPEIPLKWGQVHLIAGVVAAVLVVLRLLVPSDVEGFGESLDLDRKYGLFIAALAAIAVAVGGFLKSKEPEEAYMGGPSAYPGSQPPPPPPGGTSF